MNIDYGQIYKNASARHATLENLAIELKEIEALWLNLTASEARLAEIVKKYKAVDAEGMTLLPKDLNFQLKSANDSLALIQRAHYNIASLINEINKHKES